MKKSLRFVSGLVTLTFLLSGCSKEKTEAKSMEQLYSENGIPVKVEKTAKRPVSDTDMFHSILTGYKESTASSTIADKVEKIHYRVGDYVEKEAVVISFPTTNPATQYNQAQVSFEHAQATLQRMRNLYQSGGISQQDYENSQAQFKVAKANWEAVRQAVQVLAPISGIITQINVQETDNVQPGDKLFTVSQTEKLKSKIWVTESEISRFKPGDPATAEWNGIQLRGRVVQVDMAMNPSFQAFGLVAEFNNAQKRVMSGVNAEITVRSGNKKEIIVIDRKNILKKKNRNFVFVAQGNKAEQRDIETGKVLGLDIEVLNGLNPGDLLITEGQFLLSDGDKINIVN